MSNSKKVKICDFIIRVTGILFWYNTLAILFGNGISKDKILIITLSIAVGYLGLKAKDFYILKN